MVLILVAWKSEGDAQFGEGRPGTDHDDCVPAVHSFKDGPQWFLPVQFPHHVMVKGVRSHNTHVRDLIVEERFMYLAYQVIPCVTVGVVFGHNALAHFLQSNCITGPIISILIPISLRTTPP